MSESLRNLSLTFTKRMKEGVWGGDLQHKTTMQIAFIGIHI